VPVTVTNTGSLTWQPGVVNLGYHLYTPAGALYVWDGARTALPTALATNQTASLNAAVRLPATAGTWVIRFDLVHEGVAWFSGRGVPIGATNLTVP
jgi:hypothetical protein